MGGENQAINCQHKNDLKANGELPYLIKQDADLVNGNGWYRFLIVCDR